MADLLETKQDALESVEPERGLMRQLSRLKSLFTARAVPGWAIVGWDAE